MIRGRGRVRLGPERKAAGLPRIVAFMVDAWVTKQVIRLLFRGMGLVTWYRPVLASPGTGVPAGRPVTLK